MARGHRWLFERREQDGPHRYYLRARVPLGLVEVIGKREVKKSLRTSDRKEALGRIYLAAAEMVEQFAAARTRMEAQGPHRGLGEHEARRMAYAFFRRHDGEMPDAESFAELLARVRHFLADAAPPAKA